MTEQTTVLNARVLPTGDAITTYDSPLVVTGTLHLAIEIPALTLVGLHGASAAQVRRAELRWELNASEYLASLDESQREHLLDMARRGEIELGRGGMPEGFWDMPAPEDPEGLVREAIREDRDSGL